MLFRYLQQQVTPFARKGRKMVHEAIYLNVFHSIIVIKLLTKPIQ
jgi:hypothetical protein